MIDQLIEKIIIRSIRNENSEMRAYKCILGMVLHSLLQLYGPVDALILKTWFSNYPLVNLLSTGELQNYIMSYMLQIDCTS